MKARNLLSGLLLVLVMHGLANAQTTRLTPEDPQQNSIAMTARATGSSIKLRWAPTSGYAWRRCNESGYFLARYTLMRNNQLLPWEERSVPVLLSKDPIKPWQGEALWRPLMERNSYAAIAAQALYGESFEVETGTENDGEAAQLVNRAREESNRYTFGLFAADHSFETAIAMGLGFEDKTIRPNETYLYRVFPVQHPTTPLDTLRNGAQNTPIDLRVVIDTGFISVSAKDQFLLPKIREVEAVFGDRMATVSWNKDLFASFYVSYQVERSEDGVNWQSLKDLPYVSPEQPGANSPYMFLLDSLPMNNRPYFYRVLGNTPFDETGPPSDAVQGMGIDPQPQFFPYIVSVIQNDQNGFDLGWEFRTSDEEKIVGFKVIRAKNDKGPFEIISGDKLLAPSLRGFRDEHPQATNYYRVIAYDAYNREMSSYSALAQINDGAPPATPKNVRGTVLKNGTMVLTWDANTDPDLLGYRVYMANHPNDEFSQLTTGPALKNHFIDTVQLNTLSREIYVKVLAVDFRENRSPFSEMAVVLRPDTIAPAAPNFKNLQATNAGIALEWANSSSKDVVRHELQRKLKNQALWEVIASFPFVDGEPLGEFLDSLASVGSDYQYQIVAIDNSDLTTASPSVEARRIDNFIRPAVTGVALNADRRGKLVEITWNYPEMEKVRLFQIYRGVENAAPRRYTGLEPNKIAIQEEVGKAGKKNQGFAFSFRDKDLKMNTHYTYQVRAVFFDGGLSPLSEPIKIDY